MFDDINVKGQPTYFLMKSKVVITGVILKEDKNLEGD